MLARLLIAFWLLTASLAGAQCYTLVPINNGTVSDTFLTSGCAFDYNCVDSNDGDTSYLYTIDHNNASFAFRMTQVSPQPVNPPGPLTVHAVVKHASGNTCARTVLGHVGSAPPFHFGGTNSCTTSYTDVSDTYTIDPDGVGVNPPFTWDQINLIQVGAQANMNNHTDQVSITQVYAEVCAQAPTATFTPTDTATITPTVTVTPTGSQSLTPTGTPTPTPSETNTPNGVCVYPPTATITPTPPPGVPSNWFDRMYMKNQG